jgi:hypothetical protein
MGTKSFQGMLFPFSMVKKSAKKAFTTLLPPIPFEGLAFDGLSDRLSDRTHFTHHI